MDDVEHMFRVQMKAEIRKLRTVIKTYLEAEGHDACHLNRKALADAVGLPYETKLPCRVEFLMKCEEYYSLLEKQC